MLVEVVELLVLVVVPIVSGLPVRKRLLILLTNLLAVVPCLLSLLTLFRINVVASVTGATWTGLGQLKKTLLLIVFENLVRRSYSYVLLLFLSSDMLPIPTSYYICKYLEKIIKYLKKIRNLQF